MGNTAGAAHFGADGSAYDRFMGRYSSRLAVEFADFALVGTDHRTLDVGCGTGALTNELVRRLGPDRVHAIDPAPSLLQACRSRHAGADIRIGNAEDLNFADGQFDRVLSQLVLHFVTHADRVAEEFARVLRPGGIAAACVWDFADGMQMLRLFWDAALTVRPDAPDEATTLRFGGPGEIALLMEDAGFTEVTETTLTVHSSYADFDELWGSFLEGVGPAGAFCVSLTPDEQFAVRQELHARLGRPAAAFTLAGVARAARGVR